nr:putative ankyrin repeat protein [Megavirus caiporensis]
MLFQNYNSETKYHCSPKTRCKNFSKISYLVSHLKILDINIVVEYISNNKNEINLQNELGWTALMIAFVNYTTVKDEMIIKLLLECGANVDIQNNKGKTALMLLVSNCSENNINIVKLLLDNGADVNLKTSEKWTALMLASKNSGNNIDTIKLLLESGADVNLYNDKKWTALMLASKYSGNNIDIVKLLLDNGANINLCNDHGWTTLMLASKFCNTTSSINTVILLLEYGADINLCNDKGSTSLITISGNSKNDDNFNVVKILLNNGADPNIKNNDGHTALSYLAIKNNIETILLLLDYGVDHKINLTCNFFKHLNSENILKVINRIEKIAIIKNIFSHVCNDIKNNVIRLHLEPASFRLKILSIQWYLKTGDLEKVITWNNLSIIEYFGIYDIDSLNLKITDAIKYMS